jgi:hypothetical protein
MDDIGHLVLSSFLAIWHVIPIAIAVILFKKFINMKDRKNRLKKNEENEKNGLTLEVRTIKKYQDLGYETTSLKKQDDNTEEGIDLVSNKDDKIFIIKCDNASEAKSINDEKIENFIDYARRYVKDNSLEEKKVEFRYIVAYSDVLHKSASKILKDDFYNCKYVVV